MTGNAHLTLVSRTPSLSGATLALAVWHGLAAAFCTLLLCYPGLVEASTSPPLVAGKEPVEVAITLYINKIYDVEELEETFKVDAYLSATWSDPRLSVEATPTDSSRVYVGEEANQMLAGEMWWPALELVNGVGTRNISNRMLNIDCDGTVEYTERFHATLTAEMDFRAFPFDRQAFPVQIESFSNGLGSLIFVRPQVFPDSAHLDDTPLVDWHVIDQELGVTSATYEEQQVGPGKHASAVYSRYDLRIHARRLPGFFLWQVFLPLFLIIISSWIVFWLEEFAGQLATASTFMLTVVAFNFFVSSMLPKLPYNTFIEAVITSGYVSIFVTVGAILTQDLAARKGEISRARSIGRTCRWLIPVGYGIALVVLALWFL